MSIVICDECQKEISSNADICPHCGNPINSDGKLVMVQGTKKKWKVVMIIAWVSLVVGIIFLANDNDEGGNLIGFAIFTWLFSKIGSWWSNG